MDANERDGTPVALDALLAEVVRRLWPLHRTVVRAAERVLAGTGVTPGQHAVLDHLHATGPHTVPQVARALGLDRQPVQRLVNDAAALGLVEAVPNPEHRRSHLIRLTARGTAVITGIQRAERRELHRRLSDDVTPAEVATALRVLDRLGEAFHRLGQDTPDQRDQDGAPDGDDGGNDDGDDGGAPERAPRIPPHTGGDPT